MADLKLAPIVPLEPRADSPRAIDNEIAADVVATLEAVLERARRGEVRGVVIAYISEEHHPGNVWSGTTHAPALLASAHMAAAAYTAGLASRLEEGDGG